ncbi:MAG: hypothetical protein ACKVGW_05975, partial [Verrucomicrobiia bacterium]
MVGAVESDMIRIWARVTADN